MKRFCGFAIAFIALFACVFFSACGSKYKNLKMSFINLDEEEVVELGLIIDENRDDAMDSAKLGVKFSGIKSSEVGDVLIYCPQGKVNIPKNEISYSKNTVYFNVYASTSGVGEIVVRHLASNKTSSLNLRVDKKSHELNSLNNKYIISIPEENSKTVSFNPNLPDNKIKSFEKDLFAITPESTDLIYYALSSTGNEQLTRQINAGNVNLTTLDINGNVVIDSLTISANTAETEIVVYPIAVMDGYANDIYETETITFVLKNVLTDRNLTFISDDLHQPYLDADETITLIANDSNAVSVENRDNSVWNYEYYYLPIALGKKINGTILNLTNDYNFYNVSITTNNSNIKCNDEDLNRILICAVGKLSTPKVTVDVCLSAQNCVGEIFEVHKNLYVKAELKPETIGIKMDGQQLITNDEEHKYKLYDYYHENNDWGALFNFAPYTNLNDNGTSLGINSFADMEKMRISVKPSLLNVKGNFNNKLVGLMPVYPNSNFNPGEQITNFASFRNVRTNNYLLNFYLNDGSHPLRFYYDSGKEMFVSEQITQKDNLYIKYVKNDDRGESNTLTFSVENIYSGNLQYLKDIGGCDAVNAYFENDLGVRKITLYAGQIYSDNGIKIDSFGEELGEGNSKDVYIDRLAYNNLISDYGAYVINFNEVLAMSFDDSKNEMDSASFKVSIQKIDVNEAEPNSNGLKIEQFDHYSDNLGLNLAGVETIENFTYTTSYVDNSIVLILGERTQVGEYRITISHENGYEKNIKVFVYEGLTEQTLEIGYNLEGLNDFAYIKTEANESLFEGYESDFIVATNNSNNNAGFNRRYNFWFVINDAVLKSNIVNSYDYTTVWQGENIDEYLTLKRNSVDSKNANAVDLIFKRGTYVDGKNYITINFVVKLSKFDRLFKVENEQNEISISKTFFVFEPIFASDMQIDSNVPADGYRYSKNKLGAYYKDLANINLKLQLANELKNYVQNSQQQMVFGQNNLNDYAVNWTTSVANIYEFLDQKDYEIKVDLVGDELVAQSLEISATIKQFNRTISKTCTIRLATPILTDRVEVQNLTTEDGNTRAVQINVANQSFYIDIKENSGKLTVNANALANSGNVTFKTDNLLFQVVDNAGNKSSAISIEGNNLSVVNMAKNIKLIIFAKDALIEKLEEHSSIISPRSVLMAGHENAYLEIELFLSNGSKDNPFIINSPEDFWDIKSNDNHYYTLMDNININTASLKHQPIDNFKGEINTYTYTEIIDGTPVETPVVYTISGIELNNDFVNLFTNFNGTLVNLNFEIMFAYSSSKQNLGLIDFNYGKLTNLSLNVDGQANVSGGLVNFGTLASVNSGTISYTSNEIVGTSGKITLLGSQLSFGGLVGQNNSSILGYNGTEKTLLNNNYSKAEQANSNIVFSVVLGDSGAVSNLDVTANLMDSSSVVGGVVGVNTGEVKDVYATGKINANCIAGGIIGKNRTNVLQLSITNQDEIKAIETAQQYKIQNLTSSVVVVGADYVGGVVGYDDGGSYYNCHAQILAGTDAAIKGTNYVGGIAGFSKFGTFAYCSVMSYRWDYNELTSTFNSAQYADIVGADYVGGLIGLTESTLGNLDNNKQIYNTTNNNSLTTVMYSSVNALVGVQTEGKVYGIFNANDPDTHSIIYNSYFMGKIVTVQDGVLVDLDLKNDTLDNLAIADKNAIYNYVYSINVVNGKLEEYDYSNANTESFDLHTAKDHWAVASNLNGGYIFITLDGTNPIFEQSPTKIDSTVINPILDDAPYLMRLYYYDFVLDSTNENYQNTLTTLNNKFNRYRILSNDNEKDLINIDVEPTILGTIRIIAESDSAILSVSGNYLLVNGLGECKLTFYSALNHNVRCVVDVIISAPVGENFVLSTSKADEKSSILNTTQQIAKGKTKEYYSVASNSLNYLGVDYEYKTTSDLYLEVDVTIKDGLQIEGTIGKYISISGVQPVVDSATELKVVLDPLTAFSISVKNHLQDRVLQFAIKRFTKINYGGTSYDIFEKSGEDDQTFNFNLNTYQGPTEIKLSSTQIIIYPNGTADVYAYVTTDLPFSEEELETLNLVNGIIFDGRYVEDIAQFIEYKANNFDNNQQIVKYLVKFNEKLEVQDETELTIFFELPNGYDGESISFILVPQRIDNIEINNYIYKYDEDGHVQTDNGVAVIEPSDMLRPVGGGLIIINLSPANSYYGYLEIEDLNESGNENIIFTQIDGINGKPLETMDVETSNGKGIRLNKIPNQRATYVSTLIDIRASSKLHTVRVSAYDKFGNLITSNSIVIDIKMLPEIEMEYVNPQGVHYDNASGILYLANGVPANLAVTTRNSNGNVIFSGSFDGQELDFNNYFEIQTNNSNYVLVGRYSEDLLNKMFTLTATTTLTLNDGTFENATTSLQFKIVQYVIHNVSVNNSQVNFGQTESETKRVLNGDFGVPTVLNFYLNNFDISYLETNGTYWDSQYIYNPNVLTGNASDQLKSIHTILGEINTLEYLSLGKMVDGKFNLLTDSSIATLTFDDMNHKVHLLVNSNDDNNLVLQLQFNLALNDDGLWEIKPFSESETELQFNYKYVLNFANSTSFLEPEVVKDEEDFINMVSLPERNYILGNDLVLENYVPIDVNIASFDGNGRKIIIKSFAPFDNTENGNIYIGLFRRIYANMVVSNLEVIYFSNDEYSLGRIDAQNPSSSIFKDLCANDQIEYRSASFGGITPENEGIITNCQVRGSVALRVSAIENQRTANFNMGGLVCTNQGYITHSDSSLAMVGRANIGGLVHTNGGKIVSCSYLAENENFFLNDREVFYSTKNSNGIEHININDSGFIFAYETSATVYVGGLVVFNGGDGLNSNINEISMCNVLAGGRALSGDQQSSNITAQNGRVGGFVYSNRGNIFNCYTNYAVFGTNSNFAGFVDTNSGTINLCYTYVNKGIISSRAACTQFTTKNDNISSGITNSYEIIDLSSLPYGEDQYLRNHKVEGVDYVSVQNRFLQSSYNKFMFGDNETGSWQILNGELPHLTSVENKVRVDTVRQSTESMFYGLRTIRREESKVEVDNQIITTYHYVLLDNGYGTSTNPIILYNIATWDYYLSDNTSKYFRLVTDLDFSSVIDNPSTSTRTFSGNLQGNNMLIDNIMISSSNNLNSIGLFKELVATSDITVQPVVANLRLNTTRFTASHTQAVGILAGIIENYKIYNIEVSSQDNVLIGSNAVGGLAGIVRGNFDLDGITSSANVNAESKSGSSYSIYMSRNNNFDINYNLSDVHYAGSVVGILDGYLNSSYNINDTRYLNNMYMNVKNITVNSNLTVIGDIVGTLFGFVGERVKISNCNVQIENCNIVGQYYAAGLIGENRGIIADSSITVANEVENIFGNSRVCAGLVGLNLGGLITNCSAELNIVNVSNVVNTTVGGLVGRSVNGYIKNSKFSGKLLGLYTGGVVGTILDKDVFTMPSSAIGSLNYACASDYVVPNDVKYFDEAEIQYIDNVSLSIDSLNYWLENLSSFYSYRAGRPSLIDAILYRKVLGLAVGTIQANFELNTKYNNEQIVSKYGYDAANKQITFNGDFDIDTVGMVANANLPEGIKYNTPFANVINTISGISGTYVMYVVGANLGSLDSWARDSYTTQMCILTNEQIVELKLYTVEFGEDLEKSNEVKFKTTVQSAQECKLYLLEDVSDSLGVEFNYSFIPNVSEITTKNEAHFKDADQILLVEFVDNYVEVNFKLNDNNNITYKFILA